MQLDDLNVLAALLAVAEERSFTRAATRIGVVDGPLMVDDVQLLIRAAIDGVGVTLLMEEHAAPYLASGQLVRVLEDWCERFAGYFLYYPSRRQQPAALSALIETLRLWPHGARAAARRFSASFLTAHLEVRAVRFAGAKRAH